MSPVVTIAICTRNRAPLLCLCLESLAMALRGRPVPVLIVDNGSTDDTETVVRTGPVDAEYVREKRLGLSHARNAAMAKCQTDYLVFLDDDAKPLLGWYDAIERGLEQWKPDLFGGPYRPFYLTAKPNWFSDTLGSAHTEFGEGLLRSKTFLSGGNMGWRLSLLREAGGFNPRLGMQGSQLRLGEETQVQAYLHATVPGLRAVFLPGMEMLHYVSPEKLRLTYWWRRAWEYGWRLEEIDPESELTAMSVWSTPSRDEAGAAPPYPARSSRSGTNILPGGPLLLPTEAGAPASSLAS